MVAVAAKRVTPRPDGWRWAIGVVAVMVLGAAAVRVSVTPSSDAKSSAGEPAARPAQTDATYTDLPQGAVVAKNEGWLEVSAPNGVAVLVDGTERGRGATHVTISSGVHEVKVGEQTRSIVVRDSKSARVDFSSP